MLTWAMVYLTLRVKGGIGGIFLLIAMICDVSMVVGLAEALTP